MGSIPSFSTKFQLPKLMYYKDLETDKQAMRDYNQRMKENAASRRAKRTNGKRG